MKRSKRAKNLFLLSLAPFLSGIYVLFTTTIFWYYSDWTIKEAIFQFLKPVLLFSAFFFVLFLAFLIRNVGAEDLERKTRTI